ncbi:MAG: diguanylate cyclase [Actinobacteria bacterium]|nr:diguanylate cyclase [Actinomycetota bacterium]MCB9411490.1 diguanylate cyclase [Actinomycetota bacterium]
MSEFTERHRRHPPPVGSDSGAGEVARAVDEPQGLRRSQALYQGVFRAVGEGLIVATESGEIQQVNPAAARIIDAAEDELVGRFLDDFGWDVVDAEGKPWPAAEWPFRRALESGVPQRGKLLGVRDSDGGVRWLVVGVEAVNDLPGERLAVISFTDVTPLRRAEEDLAAEHDRLELVLTSLGFGTWDWRVTDNRIEFDQGWSHLTGHPLADAGVMTMDRWRGMIHPEERATVEQTHRQALVGGVSVYDLQYRVWHADGRWVWFRERGHVVERDAAGVAQHVMGTHEGIDELKRAQAALAASEANFRMLAENASSIVTHADNDGNLLWVSPSVTHLLGWDPDNLDAIEPTKVLHPDDLPAVRQAQRQVRNGREAAMEVRVATGVERYRWFAVLLRPIFDDDGEVVGRVAGWRDIDAEHRTREELARSREQLKFLAAHDPLTGLLNRRELSEVGEQMLLRPGGGVGLLFIDVDEFKPVNDTHGHAVGDAMLALLAERIDSCCGDSPTARFGGDEFLVLLPDVRDEEGLMALADRIAAVTSAPAVVRGVKVSLSVSIGAALARPGEGFDSLVARADVALYESKRAGRARATLHVGGR